MKYELKITDEFTGYFDDTNNPIFVGDKLKSKWNYEVIVVKNEDGDYMGELVCGDNHSCKNIPYSLNKGRGYFKNMKTTEDWINEKMWEYEQDPKGALATMLAATNDVMLQYKNNPTSKAAKGVFDACIAHNKLFLKEVCGIDAD